MAGWDRQFVKKLWGRVDLKTRYNFRTGPMAQDRLRAILKLPPDFFEPHPEQLNKPLREKLEPHLKTGDQLSKSLARWIIVDWGHILEKRSATIREWMTDLGDFNDHNVEKFIAQNDTHRISSRISSWSKLLAFADHKRQAIYDARTSVALNCALRSLGDDRQFYMPSGRNGIVKAAQRRLLTEVPRPRAVGYREYIELLQSVVEYKSSSSISSVLGAEMALFANAPCVARQFVADGR